MGRLKEKVKFRISKEERIRIARTPPRECYNCELLNNNLFGDSKGHYYNIEWLEDEGLIEHLEQIVKREIPEVPA